MAPLPPAAMTSIRPRRVFAFFTILIGFLLIFGVPWSLPPSLRDAGISALSRANIAHLVKSTSDPTVPPPKIDEIYGLLHLVTADTDEEYSLDSVTDLDPMQPINMTVYAAGDKKINWSTTVKRLDKNYPIVVFSKSYCPYSRKAKKLLESYNIQPPPKVIEVNLRADSDIVKAVLTRLTEHSTFPNIIIRGKSIGGSDDLQALHAQRTLTKVLEQAGAVVRNDEGSGK